MLRLVESYIRNIMSNIWRSEFNRNILTLVSGTAIAQAIPILATPILTRLYNPADFGAVALFISVVAIVSVICCGRYELAIMLPESDDEAVNLAAAAFIFNIFISFAFLLFLCFFGDWLLIIIKAEVIGMWIYLAPLVVFFMGVFSVLNYLNNRFKLYKDIALAKIYRSMGMVAVQLGLGILNAGYVGLVIGHVVGHLVADLRLLSNLYGGELIKKIKVGKMKYLLIKYKKFPLISTWSGLMNTLGYQLLNILIGAFFGSTVLGQFYLAYRILGMPVSLISSSIAQVFYQQANEEKIKTGKILYTFKKTLKQLIFISLVIFVPIFFVVKPAFTLIFGEQWKEAGLYAMILTPMFAIRFVSGALSLSLMLFQKQHIELLLNLFIIIATVGVLFFLKESNFCEVLLLLTLLLIIIYFGVIFYYYYLAGGSGEIKDYTKGNIK